MSVPANRPSTSGFHWLSGLQLAFSLLGIAALWSLALVLLFISLTQRFSLAEGPGTGISFLLLATASGTIGLLLVPSAGYALLRLAGRLPRHPRWPRWMRPSLAIFLLPIVLAAGYWVAQQDWLAWLVLPPVHILAIGIPIVWLVYLAVRGLPVGSPQRFWGLVASGSALAPFVILLIETLVLVGGIIALSLWISSTPGLPGELSTLAERLEQSRLSGSSPEIVVHILAPYLNEPLMIFSVFAFGALIVPLIEEALKPLGVWILAGSGLRPVEGFTAGILCGAGYALAESLMLGSSGGEEWGMVVFARLGTGVIHSLTAGLTGWALALAWSQRSYLRLGLAYLGAVLIHGLWNGLTILLAFTLLNGFLEQPLITLPERTDALAGTGLVLLAFLCLAAVLWINARFRRKQQAEDVV